MSFLARKLPGVLSLLALAGAVGCGRVGHTPPPGPPPLGLDAGGVLRTYVETRPTRFKLRQQVGVTIHDRHEAMLGVLVVEHPSRFWVRAMTPVGVSLFDVRAERGRAPTVTTHAASPSDPRTAQYLARDIQRIYMDDCPADAAVHRHGNAYQARCDMPHDGRGDDELRMDLTPGGVVWHKRFLRDGVVTAYVDYADYRIRDDIWWAHRIVLSRPQPPYRLTVVLIDADAELDVGAILDRAGAEP